MCVGSQLPPSSPPSDKHQMRMLPSTGPGNVTGKGKGAASVLAGSPGLERPEASDSIADENKRYKRK